MKLIQLFLVLYFFEFYLCFSIFPAEFQIHGQDNNVIQNLFLRNLINRVISFKRGVGSLSMPWKTLLTICISCRIGFKKSKYRWIIKIPKIVKNARKMLEKNLKVLKKVLGARLLLFAKSCTKGAKFAALVSGHVERVLKNSVFWYFFQYLFISNIPQYFFIVTYFNTFTLRAFDRNLQRDSCQ